jgi:hypothetical protein
VAGQFGTNVERHYCFSVLSNHCSDLDLSKLESIIVGCPDIWSVIVQIQQVVTSYRAFDDIFFKQ